MGHWLKWYSLHSISTIEAMEIWWKPVQFPLGIHDILQKIEISWISDIHYVYTMEIGQVSTEFHMTKTDGNCTTSTSDL